MCFKVTHKQLNPFCNDFFLPFRDAVYKVSTSPEELVEQEEEVDGEESEEEIADA